MSPRVELAIANCPHGGGRLCRRDVPATPCDHARCVACVEREHPELGMEATIEPEVAAGCGDAEACSRPIAPVIMNRIDGDREVPSGLDGAYAGQRAFLVCAGPSLASVDVGEMHRTRAMVMAVNNAGAYRGVRPHFWTCVDHPQQFHSNIWMDPAIRKIIPGGRANCMLRRRRDGELVPSGVLARQAPSVSCFELSRRFDRDRFLPESCCSWGCDSGVTCSEGLTSGRSVMLVALKLLFVLGFSEVYLVGCDFRMDAERPYAFPQRKDPVYDENGKKISDPIATNNRSYAVLSRRLAALAPILRKAGMTVFNATSGSHLDVFTAIPYSLAIQRASEGLERDADLSGWY